MRTFPYVLVVFLIGLLVLQGVSAGSILNGSEIGANSKTYLQNFNDLVGGALLSNVNSTVQYTVSGVTYLTVPEFQSSTSCSLNSSGLVTTYLGTAVNGSIYEVRSDAFSEAGIVLAMSNRSNEFDAWVNFLEIMDICGYGQLPCWVVARNSTIGGNQVKLAGGQNDTAIDGDVRSALALYIAVNNTNFTAGNRSRYLALANNLTRDIYIYDTISITTKNTRAGVNVTRLPMGGGDCAGAGLGCSTDMWIGYMGDNIKVFQYAYYYTRNGTYNSMARNFTAAAFSVSLQNDTDGDGFGVAPFNFNWNTGLTYLGHIDGGGVNSYHYAKNNPQWDDSDAPRFENFCDILRIQNLTNGTIDGPYLNASQYCRDWSETGTYTGSTSSLQYFYNGTCASNCLVGGLYENGLGAMQSTYWNTTLISPKINETLTHYSWSTYKYDSTSCGNALMFRGSKAQKALGSAMNLDLMMLLDSGSGGGGSEPTNFSVMLYHFDGNFNDSARGVNLQNGTPVSFSTDVKNYAFGQSVNFTGANSLTRAGINTTGNLTVVFWFKTSLNNLGSGYINVLALDGGTNKVNYMAAVNSTTVYFLRLPEGLAGETIRYDGLTGNTWYKAALVVNTSSGLQLWVNDVNVANASSSFTLGNDYASDVSVGYSLKYGNYYTGLVDELGVYNTSLTAAQMLALNPDFGAARLTVQVLDNVTGSYISGFCINATGTNTTQYLCNATGNTISFNTTGTYAITAFNITSGNTTPRWFNTTINNYAFSDFAGVVLGTSQALLSMQSLRLFLNTTIASFNGTNNQVANSTSTGTLTLMATNGTNNVKIDVSGNYSVNVTCTVTSPLQTVYCNATGIYDDLFTIGASNDSNGQGIASFYATMTNTTLGVFANASTSTGNVTFRTLQGYNYLFTLNATVLEFGTATLRANASTNLYNFSLRPSSTFNFTVWNESTNTMITENVTLLIYRDDFAANYSFSGGSIVIPLLTPGDYTITYWVDPDVPRNYYYTLTSQSYNNVKLYVVDEGISNLYLPIIINGNTVPVANVTVQLLRDYIISDNTHAYSIVEMAKTDTNGQAVLRVVPNIIDYKLVITDGTNTLVTTPTKFTANTNTYTFNTEDNPTRSLVGLESIGKSLTFDNNTLTYTFTWSDLGNIVSSGCLKVTKFKAGTQTTDLNGCLDGSSGSITHTINDTNGTSYIATGTLITSTTFSTLSAGSLSVDFGSAAVNFGLIGFLIAFVIFLTFVFVGGESGIAGALVSGFIAILIAGAFGFIASDWTRVVIPIAVIVGIIIYKLRG